MTAPDGFSLAATLHAWRETLAMEEVATPSTPQSGQVWTLAWNAEPFGVVMVVRYGDTYSFVLPVVPMTFDSVVPGIVPLSDGRADVWLAAGFGVGNFMFDCRLAAGVSSTDLKNSMRDYYTHDIPTGAGRDPQLTLIAEIVVAAAQRACEVTWPSARIGEAVLDRATLAELGMTPRMVARLLGLAPGSASSLWNGQSLPTADQVARLAESVGASPQDVIRPFEGDEEVAVIQPAVKQNVMRVADRTGVDEPAARALILEKALRRGRVQSGSSDTESARARVDNAIRELLSDVQDG